MGAEQSHDRRPGVWPCLQSAGLCRHDRHLHEPTAQRAGNRDAGVIGNKYQDATAPLALQVVLCQHRVRLLLSMADPNKRAALRSAPMADMPWGRVPKDLIVTRADGLQEHDSAMQVSSDTVVQTRGPMVTRRMDDKNSNDKA